MSELRTTLTPSERIPAEVWPLASFLVEEMEARGWKTDDVAVRMGGTTVEEVSRDLLCLDLLLCVQDDKLLLGDMPAKLAKAFDTSEDLWTNLDAYWRKYPERRADFDCPESIFGPASRRALIRVVK